MRFIPRTFEQLTHPVEVRSKPENPYARPDMVVGSVMLCLFIGFGIGGGIIDSGFTEFTGLGVGFSVAFTFLGGLVLPGLLWLCGLTLHGASKRSLSALRPVPDWIAPLASSTVEALHTAARAGVDRDELVGMLVALNTACEDLPATDENIAREDRRKLDSFITRIFDEAMSLAETAQAANAQLAAREKAVELEARREQDTDRVSNALSAAEAVLEASKNRSAY